MPRNKELVFSAFLLNSVSHITHGLWRVGEAENVNFNSLDHWTGLARQLDDWGYDLLFFASGTGLGAPWNGSHEIYFRTGLHTPGNDPAILISALAAATRNIGLVFTSSIIQEHPFQFARKISSLDHYTRGRVGWNIVTTASANAHRNFGGADLVEHDERYRWAQEYVDVAYKLWEGSWDDDALIQDKATGVHADATKVHRIDHTGPRYSVEGPHLVSPSPQRTPYLFQAGSSAVGQAFAAQHAEGTFLLSSSPGSARTVIDETRALAEANGRRPDDILFFQGLSFVLGRSESEAQEKASYIYEHRDEEAVLVHVLSDLGFDGGHLTLDTPVSELPTELNGIRGHVRSLENDPSLTNPTLRDLAGLIDGRNRIVGTPATVADQLQAWADAGIDGVNVIPATLPGGFRDTAELLFPELERRGLFRRDKSGSLRHKLKQRGDQLPDTHPARTYRGAFAGASVADRVPAARA